LERPILSDNEMWESFGSRALGRIVYGGAELGECRAAIAAVGTGGVNDWYRAWAAIADCLAAAGDASAAKESCCQRPRFEPRRHVLRPLRRTSL